MVSWGVGEPGEEGNDKGSSSLGAGTKCGGPPCHEQEAQGQAGAHVGAVVVLTGLAHDHHRGRPLQPSAQPCISTNSLDLIESVYMFCL